MTSREQAPEESPMEEAFPLKMLINICVVIGVLGFCYYQFRSVVPDVDIGPVSAYAQVSANMIEQYKIAVRQGDPIQICVQAGLVAASYLQASDEANYRQWKKTEVAQCRTAGVR